MRLPSDIGAPAKFRKWRDHQRDAILEAACSKERFIGLRSPTGSGKSLTYWSATRFLELAADGRYRAAYLMATKYLQDQLSEDFPDLIDIRGQSNYTCLVDAHTVDQGVCHLGIPCSLRSGGCLYFDRLKLAQTRRRVLTNYDLWMSIYAYADGLGGFDTLVLDEAHEAPDKLADFLSVFIGSREAREIGLGSPPANWRGWARDLAGAVRARLVRVQEEVPRGFRVGDGARGPARFGGAIPRGLKTTLRELKHLKRLAERADRLAMAHGDWVMEPREQGHVWTPVWPAPYAEAALFRGAVKVILVSATLNHKTMDLLGIPRDNRRLIDTPSTFPKERRPVFLLKFNFPVRLSAKVSAGELALWVERIDQILDLWPDVKAVIHTKSYERGRYLRDRSRHSRRMLLHTRETAAATVDAFRASLGPRVLVSPSMTTGVNFPYDQCRVQIVAKVPFPDVRSGVMRARHEQDKTYRDHVTMTELEQEVGRGMRAPDDWCYTYVVDEMARWFVFKHQQLASPSFMASVRVVEGIPPRPASLPAGPAGGA